jgi:hypothetical protein
MDYVFITGMGRSGTKFLTNVLGHIEGVHSVHEHIGNREFWLLSWYLPPNEYTIPFLERKKKEVERNFKPGVFIDTNGYVQNAVPELRTVFQPRKVFHFVRDPREVVRSIYTRRNEKDIHLIPKTKAEILEWFESDKFTQICWNWANTTEQLLKLDTELIHFEKIKSDFEYFESKILKPIGLEMTKSKWQEIVAIKVNKTHAAWYRWMYAKLRNKVYIKDELPKYPDWTAEQKQKLVDICGPAMVKCGYKI